MRKLAMALIAVLILGVGLPTLQVDAREGYEELDLQTYEELGYWNSGDGAYNADPGITTHADNSPHFIATARFTKEDIPNGSIIVIDEGFQYRPDGWVAEGEAAPGRPDNVPGPNEIVVDDAWWGNFEYRGFNLAQPGNHDLSDIYDEVVDAFTIWVPVEGADEDPEPTDEDPEPTDENPADEEDPTDEEPQDEEPADEEDEENPQTLDMTNNGLYLVLAGGSLLTVLFLAILKRKSFNA